MTTTSRAGAVPRTASAPPADGTLRFIGNATVLIRHGGFTVLTDPNFLHRGEKADLGYGMTTTRLTDPAMEIGELPPLDLVVLSHYHGDHFDEVAEAELDRSVPIVAPPEAADTLAEKGFGEAIPLRTWDAHEMAGPGGSTLRVTAMPGRHAPGVMSIALPDVMGSLLEFEAPDAVGVRRIYISGDTLIFERLREIPERYPELDLALLHLGGTRVAGVTVTMDAEQGVELLRIVEPRTAVPIHYDDYEAFKSPLSDFVDAVERAGLSDRVRYVGRGEILDLRATNAGAASG
jgi:L-ascorbate metabolism protein UlaG (beta-lactamase superfamily)